MAKKRRRKPSYLPQILAISGVALLIIAILAFKEKPQSAALPGGTSELPEAQLDRALAEGHPTLAFFHSDNCYQCLVMMDIVDQVYPDFAQSVTLVDVNVYDEANQPLLRRVRLQFIPTLIFYDPNGQAQTHVGVMEAPQLRTALAGLAGGE